MKISSKIVRAVFVIEITLAVLLVGGVVLGFADILRYFNIIYLTSPMETFPVMQTFLGHVLTLVIGLELAVMLVRHTPSGVIEVLLYAIARKTIIDSKTMLDILLGIVAIGGLLLINKVFDPARNFVTDINIVNPATLIKDLNKRLGINIPENIGNTIGGAVVKLCQEGGEKLAEGKRFRVVDAEITVLNMDNGLIRELKVVKREDKDELNNEI